MNRGLTPVLKNCFPQNNPVIRPLVNNLKVPDPYWIAGFTSGDGGFFVGILPNKDVLLKHQVRLKFDITQDSRDEQFIRTFVTFFDCGSITLNRGCTCFRVENYTAICDKIIPFFLIIKL